MRSDKSDKGDFGSHHVYYFESRLTSNEDDSQHTTLNDFVVPASLVVICSTSLAKLGASWLSNLKACSITTLLQVEMGPSINVPSRARHTNNRQLTAIGAENDPPGHQLGPFLSEFSQNTLTQNPRRNVDEVWWTVSYYDSNCSLPVVFILFFMNRRWTHWSSIHRPDFSRGRDHLFFLDQGLPAVRFTEPYENFAH